MSTPIIYIYIPCLEWFRPILRYNPVTVEKSEYAVTANELKNKSDIPIRLFLPYIGYQ